ncbi:AraC family transcriptional regulator [Nocardioides sp. NPDC051685]|uniref:AraC family transcriptional regulator n=1 Tax=Nocardioides sp. NPDC051685 TaxID=3364334 RepID=UPI0037BB8928
MPDALRATSRGGHAIVMWDVNRTPCSAQLLVGLAADHGVSIETCLSGIRLTEEVLHEPSSVVSARDELAVIDNVVRELGDPPGLGLEAGVRYHLTTFGIWGYALMSSPSLWEALRFSLRFVDLSFTFCQFQMRERDGVASIVLDTQGLPLGVRRFVIERETAALHRIQRELLGTGSAINRIRFNFGSEGARERYTEVFGVTPEFDADENAVYFDHEMLHRPLPQANEHTAAITEDQCRRLLAIRNAYSSMAGRVRSLLLAQPSQPPSLEQVAAVLNVSDRTLRRRLADESTTFRCLLDECREQLAEELLVTAGLTVSEVAARLGYLEVSSFSQAFRRWKGIGPRAYRSLHAIPMVAADRTPAGARSAARVVVGQAVS